MKSIAALTTVTVLALSGCASNAPVQSNTQAEASCRSFVTQEGLGLAQIGKGEAIDGGFRVPVRVEDKVGRRVDNACIISSGQTRWASPLPAGIALR